MDLLEVNSNLIPGEETEDILDAVVLFSNYKRFYKNHLPQNRRRLVKNP